MNAKQVGMTLIELTVVLLILVGLAGVVVPYATGVTSASLCKATDISMNNIKRAIMDGFYMDTLGQFPKKTKAGSYFNLTYLFDNTGSEFTDFNPGTGLGWRGPYLTNGVKPKEVDVKFSDSSLGFVHDNVTIDQFHVLDAWGNPIIIQKTTDNGFRLISAGQGTVDSDGNLVAKLDTKITQSRSNDDRVLYINKPAPEMNPSCDE